MSFLTPRYGLRVASIVLMAAAMGSTSRAADAEADLIAKVYADLTEGNPLLALKAVRKYQETHADYRQSEALCAYLITVYSQLGLYQQALEAADWANDDKPTADLNPLRELKAVDAREPILRRAKGARIVMVNEAHHVPQSRAFMLDLLAGLREQGFNYFAAETLAPSDTGLAARGYPVLKTGFYSAEPLYGELIRTALRLGFKVIPYEPEDYADSEQREELQATNLVERVFKDDPAARLVVYAGYGHIAEGKPDRDVKTLAQRLKLKTGIDPLTVDQTQMREHASRDYEHPLFRYAADSLNLNRPSIFVDSARNAWSAQPDMYDVTVFLPRSGEYRGRPKWLSMQGNRKFWRVPADICAGADECLLKARLSTESEDAIPVDAILVNGRERERSYLLLPKGTFALTATDVNGTVVNRLAIHH